MTAEDCWADVLDRQSHIHVGEVAASARR